MKSCRENNMVSKLDKLEIIVASLVAAGSVALLTSAYVLPHNSTAQNITMYAGFGCWLSSSCFTSAYGIKRNRNHAQSYANNVGIISNGGGSTN